MRIYGGGLAGLLAGAMFPMAEIFEAGLKSQVEHKAVLRFRSSAVGDAVGIEFRKVRVHKAIWNGGFVSPNICDANNYSRKVIGRLSDRSLWNIDPVDRWIAPENFLEQLAERCDGRVHWCWPITAAIIDQHVALGDNIISTLPMPVVLKLLGIPLHAEPIKPEHPPADPKFESSPIAVKRWRIKNSDVFQTVYFPDPQKAVYRASITGDLLIAEYINTHPNIHDELMLDYKWRKVLQPFGLDLEDVEAIETTSQRFGKIAPIDDRWRRQRIFELSQKRNIFSLGRYGTWRNILLDDVLHDISVIKKLINVSAYDRAMTAAR